ncbi:MAG: UDP-N-acetylglucosamine--N-acetylmuramyl-(pentapeptide) pyrophosphoryl-undecaprenol N-acetylglucosamine transferase [Bacteriovoracia bacterium]
MSALVVLVAGGTGGHINAAIAMGERLKSRGYEIQFLTGQRPLDHKLFQGLNAHHLESWPLRTKNPIKLLLSLVKNFRVFVEIYKSFKIRRPEFAVGAGGYVCGPTLLAAKLQGIPVFIIEQNAVLGLTNRLLAKFSNLIFTHFKNTRNLPGELRAKVRVVGNPTRSSIVYTAPRKIEAPLRVLVFGGSLGAQQINRAIELLIQSDPGMELDIVHQTGADQKPQISIAPNVSYRPTKYIDNIQLEYAWADVVVARAGASTVSELRIIRKPCLLVPYPKATDNHQVWNARELKEEKVCAVQIADENSTAEALRDQLLVFLKSALKAELQASQDDRIAVDSADKAIEEIIRHVGTLKKN